MFSPASSRLWCATSCCTSNYNLNQFSGMFRSATMCACVFLLFNSVSISGAKKKREKEKKRWLTGWKVSLCGVCCTEFKEFWGSVILLHAAVVALHLPSASCLHNSNILKLLWVGKPWELCIYIHIYVCVWLNMRNSQISCGCVFISLCVRKQPENSWWESSRGVWFLKILSLLLCWGGLLTDRRQGMCWGGEEENQTVLRQIVI